jgi:hypothetical protein
MISFAKLAPFCAYAAFRVEIMLEFSGEVLGRDEADRQYNPTQKLAK